MSSNDDFLATEHFRRYTNQVDSQQSQNILKFRQQKTRLDNLEAKNRELEAENIKLREELGEKVRVVTEDARALVVSVNKTKGDLEARVSHIERELGIGKKK